MKIKPQYRQLPCKVAVIFLTSTCNMKCPYCITENYVSQFSTKELKNYIEQLSQNNFTHIVLGGGEPLLWKGDLKDITKFCKYFDLHVQIGTNGIFLDKNLISWPYIDRFVLPLDSIRENIHNSLRPTLASHFQIILEKIHTIGENKKSLTISSVVTKLNYHCFSEIYYFLENYQNEFKNLHGWHIYNFIDQGRYGSLNSSLKVSDKEYETLFQKMILLKKLSKEKSLFKIFKRQNMYTSDQVTFFWLEKNKVFSSINHPNF